MGKRSFNKILEVLINFSKTGLVFQLFSYIGNIFYKHLTCAHLYIYIFSLRQAFYTPYHKWDEENDFTYKHPSTSSIIPGILTQKP